MKTPLDRLRQQFRQQAEKAPWLNWAALAIGVLLALLLLQGLEDLRRQASRHAMDKEVQLRKMRSLRGQDVWLEREKQTGEQLAALQAQIPPAPTVGAAQANLQSWLQELANSTPDPSRVRVSLEGSAPVEEGSDLLRIRATLRGGMPPRTAINLVRRIETAPSLVVIESLDIRADTSSTTSIAISAFYRVAPAPQGAAP